MEYLPSTHAQTSRPSLSNISLTSSLKPKTLLLKDMKSVSRNKFFLCLRPTHDMDATDKQDYSTYKLTDGSVHSSKKRTLSRAVRAVMCQIILSRGVRNKKSLSSSKQSNSSSSEGSYSSSSSSPSSWAGNESKTEDLENQESKTDSGQESRTQHKPFSNKCNNQDPSASAKQSIINYGLFLFLISLAITVLLGKHCAILLTSILLYSLPLSRGPDAAATKSNHCKKRAIKERKHCRVETESI